MGLCPGNGKHRRSNIVPHARKIFKPLVIIRNNTTHITDHNTGSLVEISGSGIIPKALPGLKHGFKVCGGKVSKIRPGFHEPEIVGDHGFDLGLLEHNLGDPHAVQRGIPAPGKLPAIVPVPAH